MSCLNVTNYFALLMIWSGFRSWAWDISSYDSDHCAKVFVEGDFKGRSFVLKDKELIPYLSDVQNSNDIRQISAKVKTSCSLTLSTLPFLRGDEHELAGNVNSFRLEGEGSFQNSSILCTCRKSCSCNDVLFRGRECARGYFNSDCTNCDAFYTSFKYGDSSKLSSKYVSAINTFIVRPSCNLSVQYKSEPNGSLETMDIEAVTKAEIVPFSGIISSTSCECDTSAPEYLSPQGRKSNLSDLPLLSIPNLRGEINAELKKPGQENHPGLLAALQSLRAKRSPKNAYILLLGLTGSGKSTAVNLLFDHPNITQVGSVQSTTTDIHEFRIPVKLDKLGISNSQLRIIDTPGIADTRGIAQDARFLATFDHFLSTHEELRRHTPNLVLIFMKFHDNRFDGSGSAFVKMLKTIELFRSRLVDPKFSNIIFVLTHFMSETKEIQRNPGPKIQRIKRVIEEYTSLPNPIVLVVAENKPEETELPSVNGYWRLPNGDHYPKNLFDQMQRTLSSCGDPIGLGVIQSAFSHSGQFEIEGKTTEIFNSSDKNVIKYLSTLSALEIAPPTSEVSEALDAAYLELDPELKSRYPSCLSHLKNVCSIVKLQLFEQIPKTAPKIAAFLKNVQTNEATSFLLERALNLTEPLYSGPLVVGSGYDLINDKPLKALIFNLSNNNHYSRELGFKLPENVKVFLSRNINTIFDILPDRNEYVKLRLRNLGLEQEATKGLDQLLSSSGGTKAGLNIVTSPDQRNLKLSALIEYQTFNIILDKESTLLSEDYLRDLRALGPFDAANFESVRLWNRFFQLYGTHAVVGASGGGNIEVEVKMNDYFTTPVNISETQDSRSEDNELTNDNEQNDEGEVAMKNSNDYNSADESLQSQIRSVDRFTRLSRTMSSILQYLANNFLGKETPITNPEGVTCSIRMLGGDPKFHISHANLFRQTGKRGNVELWNILDKWETSVQFQPEILTHNLRLIPMSEILSNTKGLEVEGAAVSEAAKAFLNASLVYVPRMLVTNSVDDRDHSSSSTISSSGDFQQLQEFAQMFSKISDISRRTQENFMSMMVGMQQENERQALLFEQQLMDDRKLHLAKQQELLEEENWKRKMDLQKEAMAKDRDLAELQNEAILYQIEVQIRAQQASQMAEMSARNSQTFFSLVTEQVKIHQQLVIAQQNQKGWFQKTLGFIGGPVVGLATALG